jgi:hypothetical protein
MSGTTADSWASSTWQFRFSIMGDNESCNNPMTLELRSPSSTYSYLFGLNKFILQSSTSLSYPFYHRPRYFVANAKSVHLSLGNPIVSQQLEHKVDITDFPISQDEYIFLIVEEQLHLP